LASLENSAVAQFILGYTWAFYGLLAVHAFGMAGVVGGSIMLSLRVLGFAVGVPVAGFELLKRVAALSFVANAGSGMLLYFTNAKALTVLLTFQIKMASILLGGILLRILWQQISPYKADADHLYDGKAKAVAATTIFFWIAAIVAGRYIAYTLPVGF